MMHPAPEQSAGVDRLTSRHGRIAFGVQAAAGAIWWVSVFLLPTVQHATLGGLDPVVVAILDIPLFVGASLLAACGVRWSVWVIVPWTVLMAGGMCIYATVTGQGGWGAVLMIGSSVLGVVAGTLLRLGRLPIQRLLAGPFAFRAARPATPGAHRRRTAAQLVVFWVVFLAVIPAGLLVLEQRWQLHVEVPVAVRAIGVVLLLAASGLGLWSAWTMSSHGEGTPLPSQTARRLVVSGPYRYVRNPMAVAGIAQGVAVGITLGSWFVVVYALCGSLAWNLLVRPFEEADMWRRFGDEFDAYRERVRCWLPRLGKVRRPMRR